MATRIMVISSLLILVISSGCQGSEPSSSDGNPTPVRVTRTEIPTPPAEAMTVSVPQGKPPTVDGVMSTGEWDQAVSEPLTDGSEILMLYTDGYLYVGIRANTPDMIVGNVFIEHGQEIAILHASAALGRAIYQRDAEVWKLVDDFTWCCRDTGDSEFARDERHALFQEQGWVATNSRIGTPNELEFQIEMADESLRMAVNYIKASEPNVKIPWPNGLDDDCIKPTPGGLPGELRFSPDKWAMIQIQSVGE